MGILSDAEKADLLAGADSQALQADLRILREYRESRDAQCSFAEYLQWLTALHEFFGHRTKPFEPITGDHFLL